jgi:hypothetical protein
MRAISLNPTSIRAFPPCPFGHEGEVRSFGFRVIKGEAFARPRFRCIHPVCDAFCRRDCDGIHYFTEGSQARTHKHPGGMWCADCARTRTLRDGRPIGVCWDFEARLIAEALISVGKGLSYRRAAQEMRVSALRFEEKNGVKIVSKWGGSVMRNLDHFGELVLKRTEHREWPEVLVLDAKPLRVREYVAGDPFSWEQAPSGAILVAAGGPIPTRAMRAMRNDVGEIVNREVAVRQPGHLWRVELSGAANRWAWLDFLSSLPGTPKWIVVDGDAAVRLAIRMRWGDGPDAPVVFSCEDHFQKKFHQHALEDDKIKPVHVNRLWPESKRGMASADKPRGPLWAPDDWRRLLDKVLAMPEEEVEAITGWIINHDEAVRRQFELRREHAGCPRGTGAVEAFIVEIGDMLGKRTQQFQNVFRTNIMLGLIHANLGHHANVEMYTRVIREELERTNGRPDINWRARHYKRRVRRGRPGPPGSLFHLADQYQKVGESEQQRAYWVEKQASSLAKKMLDHNIYHFLNGYPLLTLTDAKTTVRTSGLRLRDLPLIRREWDYEDRANQRLDPDTVSPGHDKFEVAWVCHDDPTHRWTATINARCGRLQGCPKCRYLPAKEKPSNRTLLNAVRASWGDYDDERTGAVAS